MDLICWGIIKVKILYKISGMKFSSLELKLSGFAVKPPRMKGLNSVYHLTQNSNESISEILEKTGSKIRKTCKTFS